MRVVVVIAIATALEVLTSLFAVYRDYQGRPLEPLVHPIAFLAIMALGVVTVILTLGPRRPVTWFIAILFVVVTLLGSAYLGEIVISHYRYTREFTFVPDGPTTERDSYPVGNERVTRGSSSMI